MANDNHASLLQFCPECGHSFDSPYSLVNEYWYKQETLFFYWCGSCKQVGEVRKFTEIYAMEADEEDEGH